MRHPLKEDMACAMAKNRVATFRFNYPYSENYSKPGWDSSPDSLQVLLDTAESAVKKAEESAHDLPLFVGGRSMSSQIITLLAARRNTPNAVGVIPFVFPMRWRTLLKEPTAHLSEVDKPMLFIQGGRDDLTDNDELQQLLSNLYVRTTMHVVEGADHHYNVPVDSPRTKGEAIREVASVVADWIREVT
jgi:predicted alpha/beta-hydrolase family hydrolase